jgi:hypothetical protein
LSLDGVYVRSPDGALAFHELIEPNAQDVAEVARRTALRLVKVLKKHGREVDAELGEVDMLSSHSSLRKEVVPVPAAAVEDPLDPDAGQLALGLDAGADDCDRESPARDGRGRGCCATCGRSTSVPVNAVAGR